MKVQPLPPKRKVPDHVESRRKNHLHNKIHLTDYSVLQVWQIQRFILTVSLLADL